MSLEVHVVWASGDALGLWRSWIDWMARDQAENLFGGFGVGMGDGQLDWSRRPMRAPFIWRQRRVVCAWQECVLWWRAERCNEESSLVNAHIIRKAHSLIVTLIHMR